MQYPWQLGVPAGARTRTSRVAALIVASGVIAGSSALAQNPPDPRPGASTPVQVLNTPDNPVPVTGTVTGEVKLTNNLLDVAVVNDMVTKPYLNNRSLAFSGSDVTSFREFDVPDGMRLIVETITVRVAVRTPGNAIAQFGTQSTEGFFVGGDIAMQPQVCSPTPSDRRPG